MKRLILFIFTIALCNGALAQQKLELSNQFSSLELVGNMGVELINDSVCKIEAVAYNYDIQKLKWRQKGDLLSISIPSGMFENGRVELKIHVANLNNLYINGAEVSSQTPIISQSLNIFTLSSINSLNLNLDVAELYVEASGKSDITLNGFTQWSDFKINLGAQLNAINLETTHCRVFVSGGSEAIVNATKTLEAKANSKGTVYYKGSPKAEIKTATWGAILPIPQF